MSKTYKLFKLFLPILIAEVLITVLFAVLAFAYNYDPGTSRFRLVAPFTLTFLVCLALAIGTAIFLVVKVKHLGISKIRRKNGFLQMGTYLAAAMVFIVFVIEFIRLVLNYSPKIEVANSSGFGIWRIIRLLLCLPCICHLLITIAPKKIGKKKINIPNAFKYVCGVCAVLWAIFGVLSSYFYEGLTTTNMLKNWQIIVYMLFAFFFLFEIKFEYAKPSSKPYILFALLSFIFGFAFSFSTVIARALDYVRAGMSFSEIEIVTTTVIGLYALARLFAMTSTIKHVMDNSDKGTYSSKFKNKAGDFTSESKVQNRINASKSEQNEKNN